MLLGVDFGTTFSESAVICMEQTQVLVPRGDYGIPSLFYYDRESGVLTGKAAESAGQGIMAANLVTDIKMKLNGGACTLDGRTFTAKEIVRELYRTILTTAVRIAERSMNETEIEGVVISVPAKFGLQERQLLADAAAECIDGKRIPVRAIIKEPAAAALAYFDTGLAAGTSVLVLDIGGGTCDVALVQADEAVPEHYIVIDSEMLRLGGRDWDSELADYLTQQLEAKSGRRIRGNAALEAKIREEAVRAKHFLTEQEQTTVRIPVQGRVCSVPLTRRTFDEITRHLLQQALDCVQAVYDRNIGKCEIKELICVGGSCIMPQVEEGLLRQFRSALRIRLYEPEHAIVRGAALYAERVTVTDHANFAYGAESTRNGQKIVCNIIHQGSPLPAASVRRFNPLEDNQNYVAFNIYESENNSVDYQLGSAQARRIGEVRLKLPPHTPKTASITCRITLGPDGLLEAEAREPSGNFQRVPIYIQPL